jgi:hypothetical protein
MFCIEFNLDLTVAFNKIKFNLYSPVERHIVDNEVFFMFVGANNKLGYLI